MKSVEDDNITPLFLKLPAEEIVTLKFLLESYEGFGELRTLLPTRSIAMRESHFRIAL